MSTYIAPLRDMRFVMTELADLSALSSLPGLEEVTPELADAVLEEAAKLAAEVLAPLNKTKSQIETMRAFAYVIAADMDRTHRHPDDSERARSEARVDLLIPVLVS
jgi:3-(methylthio)propanoyl-CoA dehydrogenase